MSNKIIMLVLFIMVSSLLILVSVTIPVDFDYECSKQVYDFCLDETDSEQELSMCWYYWYERECKEVIG